MLECATRQSGPISKLPPEILSLTFSFVLEARVDFRVFPTYSFSQVSERWRIVALNASCLWRTLARNVRWATAMVERSRGTELSVDDLSSCGDFSQTTLLVLEKSACVESQGQ